MTVPFLTMIGLVLFVGVDPLAQAGPGSILKLEPAGAPWHEGDHLQIEDAVLNKAEIRVITVLQTALWPLVLVRDESVSGPYELWIDFTKVRNVRTVDAANFDTMRLLLESDD